VISGSATDERRVTARAAMPVADAELLARWRDTRPFIAAGALWTTTGGLVAAVTSPLGFEQGSWTAAFLVLVGGVAQIGLGAGQAWLSALRPRPRSQAIEAVTWNCGVMLTVAGTLAAAPLLTSAGGAAIAVALGAFLDATRASHVRRGWLRVAYRALVAVVLISIPVGLVLAWFRHR
jgi:hypothetical protein